ncbi:MAG: hypothetical protein JWO69_457 [Thermoleophilia bacterium]|nr:hypothetical protein [Thermoleophilia bacterium]
MAGRDAATGAKAITPVPKPKASVASVKERAQKALERIDHDNLTTGPGVVAELRPVLALTKRGRDALKTLEDLDVKVKVGATGAGSGAEFHSRSNTIIINRMSVEDPTVLAGTLVHELTHARDTHEAGGSLLESVNTVYGAGAASSLNAGAEAARHGNDPAAAGADALNRHIHTTESNAYRAEAEFMKEIGSRSPHAFARDEHGQAHTDADAVLDEITQDELYQSSGFPHFWGSMFGAIGAASPISHAITLLEGK